MIAVAFSLLVGLFQVSETGTLIGTVKLPNGDKPSQAARVVLLPPKYTEVWNKQVQQRLDNYWETFKPEFAANKEHFADYYRIAHVESLLFVIATMRRELGDGSSKYIKETPAGGPTTGQFEFRGMPFGTYQILVQAMAGGEDVIWSRAVDVRTNVPIFVDLGKPVS